MTGGYAGMSWHALRLVREEPDQVRSGPRTRR
jgi:hypothetical protein